MKRLFARARTWLISIRLRVIEEDIRAYRGSMGLMDKHAEALEAQAAELRQKLIRGCV